MSKFMNMANSVKQQAEAFLDAEGIAHDAPLPEIDEARTQGDLVAAPLIEDRTLAALLILRTVRELSECGRYLDKNQPPDVPGAIKMQMLTNPVDWVAESMYRLRMYQDAMHAPKIRGRYMRHQSKKERKKGADREGSAAWLADHLTNGKFTKFKLNEALKKIAENGRVDFNGMPVKIEHPRTGLVTGGQFSNACDVCFHFGDEWRSVKVKRLRQVANSWRKSQK